MILEESGARLPSGTYLGNEVMRAGFAGCFRIGSRQAGTEVTKQRLLALMALPARLARAQRAPPAARRKRRG
jgi:hypothetical protein